MFHQINRKEDDKHIKQGPIVPVGKKLDANCVITSLRAAAAEGHWRIIRSKVAAFVVKTYNANGVPG